MISNGKQYRPINHEIIKMMAVLSQGVDIYAISKRLSHSDLSTTTDIYAYLIDEYKEKNDATIVSKLNDLVGGIIILFLLQLTVFNVFSHTTKKAKR